MSERTPTYEELVALRDELEPGKHESRFGTLREVCWHRDWITPMQASSRNRTGPVVMGTHWLGMRTAVRDRPKLAWYGGYDPRRSFNRVLDIALARVNLRRRDIYVTQACLLLPRSGDRASVPDEIWRESYEKVTRHEIGTRRVVALGAVAEALCECKGVPHRPLRHPGTSNPPLETQVRAMTEALRWALRKDKPSYEEW